jgi:hypothetical protein
MHVNAFLLTGAICSVVILLQYGPRRFFKGNHPIQVLLSVFVIGGVIGALSVRLFGLDHRYIFLADIPLFQITEWAGYAACLYFAACLMWDIHAWIVTVLLYGRFPLVEMLSMISFLLHSRIQYYLWAPLVPFAGMIGFHLINGSVFPISFVVSLALFWTHLLTYQFMPPSLLLLGTSRPACVSLRHCLERALYPYRVGALLDPGAADPKTQSLFTRNLLEWDNLRTSDEKWRSVVHPLMGFVPAIVLDTRVPTSGVKEETQHILAMSLSSKTFFLANTNMETPALDTISEGGMAQGIRIVPESRLVVLLKTSGFSRTTSPDDVAILQGSGDGR